MCLGIFVDWPSAMVRNPLTKEHGSNKMCVYSQDLCHFRYIIAPPDLAFRKSIFQGADKESVHVKVYIKLYSEAKKRAPPIKHEAHQAL